MSHCLSHDGAGGTGYCEVGFQRLRDKPYWLLTFYPNVLALTSWGWTCCAQAHVVVDDFGDLAIVGAWS